MTLIAATIDAREPDAIRRLDFGVPAGTALLDAGDLLGLCADGAAILVERKTVPDLLASIGDGRLLDQASRLRAATPWAYVVVTEPPACDSAGRLLLGGGPSGWTWASVQGALCSVQELGVPVVYAAGAADYAPTVCRLAARSHGAVRLAPQRAAVALSPGEVVLTALPGIGDTHARALLDYCLTPAAALSFLTADYPVGRVAGIGPATRERARAALGLRAGECLHLVTMEAQEDHS